MKLSTIFLALAFAITASVAVAAGYPAPRTGDFIAHNFKFHTGAVIPTLRLHYTTVGDPKGLPVLVLHGTGGSAASMLRPVFAGVLFGPGQPLDASKYYIIIPDSIGHGKSSKPSDGLKTKFPQYDYADMVEAQHLLLTQGLGVKHLRLVIGHSMGGMHAWMWAEKYPRFMDAVVPMASQPTPMAARNWMLRRMMIETIRRDPSYANGNYTSYPRIMRIATAFFGIATAGGTLNYQSIAPTNALANRHVDKLLATPIKADPNDFLWAWESSADYDASAGLDRIEATVLVINAADDERNPPETGLTAAAVKRLKHGSLYLVPASKDTRGHITTGMGKFYVGQLDELLKTAPHLGM